MMADLIDRQAVRDELAKLVPYAIYDTATESYMDGLTDAYNLICQLPSIQPERKKGHWIHIRDDVDGNSLYECSCCHKGEVHVPIVEVSYCWNCGADMREESDGLN